MQTLCQVLYALTPHRERGPSEWRALNTPLIFALYHITSWTDGVNQTEWTWLLILTLKEHIHETSNKKFNINCQSWLIKLNRGKNFINFYVIWILSYCFEARDKINREKRAPVLLQSNILRPYNKRHTRFLICKFIVKVCLLVLVVTLPERSPAPFIAHNECFDC